MINRKKERGNALIYVLIAVALFGALSMALTRQGGDGEVSAVSDGKNTLMATQLISYAGQALQVIDQMSFTGTDMSEYNFVLPADTVAFAAGSHIHKIFHPQGGGLSVGKLPASSIAQSTVDPVPGWYLGQFNNVEWSDGAGEEIILLAYQLTQAVCENINKVMNGSIAIPTMGDSIKDMMINAADHTGTNVEFTAALCPACEGINTLCVQNQAGDAYGFYSILAQQ